jgi:hypothetical protein
MITRRRQNVIIADQRHEIDPTPVEPIQNGDARAVASRVVGTHRPVARHAGDHCRSCRLTTPIACAPSAAQADFANRHSTRLRSCSQLSVLACSVLACSVLGAAGSTSRVLLVVTGKHKSKRGCFETEGPQDWVCRLPLESHVRLIVDIFKASTRTWPRLSRQPYHRDPW